MTDPISRDSSSRSHPASTTSRLTNHQVGSHFFCFYCCCICSLVLSRFACDFCFTLLAFLRRFVHVHRAGTPVKLLRLWFVTCCSSIRPSGPTSRTFAPIGMILLSFLFFCLFFFTPIISPLQWGYFIL